MAKYNSVNDVLNGHIQSMIEANNLDPADYPYQSDINGALIALAKVYGAIADVEVPAAADSFTITGALDVLLDITDAAITPANAEPAEPGNADPVQPSPSEP